MDTKKETELMLQNKELRKENLRLQKKLAKLEAQLVTANNKAKAQPTPKLPKHIYDAMKRVYNEPVR